MCIVCFPIWEGILLLWCTGLASLRRNIAIMMYRTRQFEKEYFYYGVQGSPVWEGIFVLWCTGLASLRRNISIMVHRTRQFEKEYCYYGAQDSPVWEGIFLLWCTGLAGTRVQSCDRYGSGICILGKFLGVVCHCFPPLLDVPTLAARYLRPQQRERS